MGYLAEIKGVESKTIKIDSGGGDLTTADRLSSAGDDSHPLSTDIALAVPTIKSGSSAVTSYLDVINDPKALEGEKRIYARRVSDGVSIAEIWLKNSGEISINNSLGEIKLEVNGDINLNGVIIDTSGHMTATSITIGGLSFSAHIHGGVTTGAGNTGGPQ